MNEPGLPLYLWIALAPLIGAFAGAYFKRRAEDIAMNANFQNVLEQVKRQTAETENIKAAISDDVWDRQRQWEMKRDAVFEAVRALGDLELALHDLASCYKIYRDPSYKSAVGEGHALHQENLALGRFVEKYSKLYQTKFVTHLFVGKEFLNALSAYFDAVGTVHEALKGETPNLPSSDVLKARNYLIGNVIGAAQKELNVAAPAVSWMNTDH